MKEHPIIYSAPMVRAYLEDRKTETRRVIITKLGGLIELSISDEQFKKNLEIMPLKCPYGQAGDTLWVREKHQLFTPIGTRKIIIDYPSGYKKAFDVRATRYIDNPTGKGYFPKWRPSIHMPRWASRLTQTITSIRVERLQGITYEDIKAEGWDGENSSIYIPPNPYVENSEDIKNAARLWYRELWDSINEKRGHSWQSNPFVWVISYPKYSEEPTRVNKE